MDAIRFDQIVRALVTRGPRRGLLGLLAALPILGGLFALPGADEAAARKNRRKGRKKPHKRASRRRKKERRRRKRQRCKAHSRAKTCANRCGVVKNSCKKKINCGSCVCDPLCNGCETCNARTAICEPDAARQGQDCGDPGQVCQADGTCACQAGSCRNPTPLCIGTVCTACTDDGQCGAGGRCCDGSCVVGVCCNNGECSGTTPICDEGVCVACQTHAACGAGFLCQEDGSCQACDVVCAAAGHTCAGTDLQAAVDGGGTVYVCPGRYTGNFTLDANVTVIGAGDGEDPATSTILDANDSGRTLEVREFAVTALEGVRITGGNGTNGGGVFSEGRLVLTACTISGNTANRGGGFYLAFAGTGALTLSGCQVSENTASTAGGGIHNNSIFTTTLSGCTVFRNASTQGGGLYNNSGDFTIHDTEISANEAGTDGGGVFNGTSVASNPGTMTFDADSRVTNNRAGTGGAGSGGGIFNEGTVALNGAAVTDNEPNNCAGNPITGCIEGA